jgi:pimeloyl-ACP methyl ester carboxylesterase
MATTGFRQSRLAPNCQGLEPPAGQRLAEVEAPTLIAVGGMDADDIHAIGKLIHAGVKGSRLERFGRAGHMLPMEEPLLFNHIVGEFFAR